MFFDHQKEIIFKILEFVTQCSPFFLSLIDTVFSFSLEQIVKYKR